MMLLPKSSWEVKTTDRKGRGIFSKTTIAPGTVMGDYIGKVIRTAEEDTYEKDGLYLMYYHDYASLFPEDVDAPGIHLLNHSCAPNAWMYTYHGHTLFFALRQIFAGEELTVSYLLSPNADCDPCQHACKCGHIVCTGTMHQTKEHFDRWDAFNDAEAKKTKRATIRYGKVLSLLPSYPETIEDNDIYDLFGSEGHESLVLQSETKPTKQQIRALIRETGRMLLFPKLQTKILGIKNDEIVSQALEEAQRVFI